MSKIDAALASAAAKRKAKTGNIEENKPEIEMKDHGYPSDLKKREKKPKTKAEGPPVDSEHQYFIPEILPPEIVARLDSRIIALFSSRSMAAEQYRLMRTKILRSFKLYSHSAFLVSSSLPGEGKTTTTICLAISIAQSLQNSVILIDADLRRPSIHNYLGIEMEQGLSDHLSRQLSLESVIKKTCISKLSVITAGTIPPNPSELVLSDRMTNMITELKNRYSDRIVLVDSPPIISLTDSVILSQKLDGVILVIHAKRTPKVAIKDTIETLSDCNIIGVVLNHLDGSSSYYKKYKYKSKYGYGYGYGYGYKYGSGYGYGYGYDQRNRNK